MPAYFAAPLDIIDSLIMCLPQEDIDSSIQPYSPLTDAGTSSITVRPLLRFFVILPSLARTMCLLKIQK